MGKKGEHGTAMELTEWFDGAERVVIVGIGNPMRMDDFVGVKIVQDLRGKVSDRVMLIEAETVPENYVQQIADFKPTHVLLIDAALMGLKAGDHMLTDADRLESLTPVSTHALPLRIFCELLQNTKAKVGLLLFEPKQTDFGESMSCEVQSSLGEAGKTLQKLLSQCPCSDGVRTSTNS